MIVIPGKGQFRPGEPLQFEVRAEAGDGLSGGETVKWRVFELERVVLAGEAVLAAAAAEQEGHHAARPAYAAHAGISATVEFPAFASASAAYALQAEAASRDGAVHTAETAFDVAAHCCEAPRYGFLSDFAPEELGKLDDVEFLRRHHINLVQFYDWMYRHDQLLTEQDEFVDPLNRRLSMNVVREKIAALREYGIASMAYAAIYGSLPDYAERHPEQVLYQNDGTAHTLGNFFYIMDISEDSAWTSHIIGEFRQAVEQMGFDGLQMDQYGFPKKAIRRLSDGKSDVVELKKLYPRFIDLVRERLGGDVVLIYNNVGNFPTHTTAGSRLDAMYIEVWEPERRLGDLKRIIDNARRWSGKQVVLAAYLPAFHPERPADRGQAEIGARLAMAAIYASGGYHLSLGEERALLTDPYFPNYGVIGEGFADVIRRHYDFIVMYRDLLFDLELDDISMALTGGINTEVMFEKEGVVFDPGGGAGQVWTFVKEKPGYLVLHAINLAGVSDDLWMKEKSAPPTELRDIEVKVEVSEQVEGVFAASPDADSVLPTQLAFDTTLKAETGQYVRFTLPPLAYWTMVYVKLRDGVPAAFERK